LGLPAPPPPDATPAPRAAERRAGDGVLQAALAACATLAARLAALPSATDDAEQRQVLRQLAAPLHAAGVALARLDAAGADESPGVAGGGDPLTGLADRAQLATASAALSRRFPDTPLMLIAVDVDHLRHVNDAWSRATGDAVLQAVASVLRAQSRPQDVLARADADRFVVALGGPVSTTRALLVAERLRAAVEGHAWEALGTGLRVTASIGVAARAPGETLASALARAGAALTECKGAGRNQVRSRA
jgi:diguanylate cyclase (GGDEF)-like protein